MLFRVFPSFLVFVVASFYASPWLCTAFTGTTTLATPNVTCPDNMTLGILGINASTNATDYLCSYNVTETAVPSNSASTVIIASVVA